MGADNHGWACETANECNRAGGREKKERRVAHGRGGTETHTRRTSENRAGTGTHTAVTEVNEGESGELRLVEMIILVARGNNAGECTKKSAQKPQQPDQT